MWKWEHVWSLFIVMVTCTLLILGVVLSLVHTSNYNRSHPDQVQLHRIDACKSIPDPAQRTICIRGTGY